jgi:hypothetical protein
MYQQLTTYVVLCYSVCTMAVRDSPVRDSTLAYNQPCRVHRCALQSEGRIILINSHFIELRVYFHPYYDMTLGFKSLGLVVVLF